MLSSLELLPAFYSDDADDDDDEDERRLALATLVIFKLSTLAFTTSRPGLKQAIFSTSV